MNKLNYNAETGWNALGTGLFGGRGAFDDSMQPKYRRVFESIEGEPLRQRQSGFDQDVLAEALADYRNTRNAFGAPNESNLIQQTLDGTLSSLASSFGNYSGTALENALAGKYLGIF